MVTDTEVLDLAVEYFMGEGDAFIVKHTCDQADRSINDLALEMFGDKARKELEGWAA